MKRSVHTQGSQTKRRTCVKSVLRNYTPEYTAVYIMSNRGGAHRAFHKTCSQGWLGSSFQPWSYSSVFPWSIRAVLPMREDVADMGLGPRRMWEVPDLQLGMLHCIHQLRTSAILAAQAARGPFRSYSHTSFRLLTFATRLVSTPSSETLFSELSWLPSPVAGLPAYHPSTDSEYLPHPSSTSPSHLHITPQYTAPPSAT